MITCSVGVAMSSATAVGMHMRSVAADGSMWRICCVERLLREMQLQQQYRKGASKLVEVRKSECGKWFIWWIYLMFDIR